jgi:tRNA threonylcarbamoyl adenosine modification protein (Sua5/YciO/YrdC/YwlC family)
MALDVPFVDVRHDHARRVSIPLTANEWRQWGDPREKAAYLPAVVFALRQHRPQDYPAMLVTTALWDSQVQYFEPAKYVARLRASKTDRNPLLLHVEMNAGHGGAAGRYERLRTGRDNTPSSSTWPAWLRCPSSRLSPPGAINGRCDPLILHVPVVRSPSAEPPAAAAPAGGADPARRGMAAVPTDSSYALVCRLDDKAAVEALRRVRQVDEKHHLTLLCRDLSELASYARVDNQQYRLLKLGTPGPFTFILEATKEVPRRVSHPSRRTIGLRVPDHKVAAGTAGELYGQPLLGTTLIPPGETEPLNDAQEIRERFQKQVQAVVDAGACPMAPTTVIDLSGGEAVLLRQGRGELSRLGL